MKRSPSAVVIILLIGLMVGLGALSSQYTDLQTQLLRQDEREIPTTVEPLECEKLSEGAANSCYLKKALEENDDSYCDDISKPSLVQTCQREVELVQ